MTYPATDTYEFRIENYGNLITGGLVSYYDEIIFSTDTTNQLLHWPLNSNVSRL